MTSTSTNSGYSLPRNSSKVIQPPGGRTADIFGRTMPEQDPSSASSLAGSDVGQQEVAANQQPMGLDGQMNNPSEHSSANMQQGPLVTADDFKPVHQQALQTESTQQQSDIPYNERTAAQQAKINVPLRRNPITGEVFHDPAAVTRVRQPPGGRSSGIF